MVGAGARIQIVVFHLDAGIHRTTTFRQKKGLRNATKSSIFYGELNKPCNATYGSLRESG